MWVAVFGHGSAGLDDDAREHELLPRDNLDADTWGELLDRAAVPGDEMGLLHHGRVLCGGRGSGRVGGLVRVEREARQVDAHQADEVDLDQVDHLGDE